MVRKQVIEAAGAIELPQVDGDRLVTRIIATLSPPTAIAPGMAYLPGLLPLMSPILHRGNHNAPDDHCANCTERRPDKHCPYRPTKCQRALGGILV
jgi:hypothetical protein